jgi:hypothetical protein
VVFLVVGTGATLRSSSCVFFPVFLFPVYSDSCGNLTCVEGLAVPGVDDVNVLKDFVLISCSVNRSRMRSTISEPRMLSLGIQV